MTYHSKHKPICGCEEMICNRCGNVIPVEPDQCGGYGEFETFYYDAIGGKRHTHCCLVCQMEIATEKNEKIL